MRRDLVEILRCPEDLGTLALAATAENDDGVAAGTLTCDECGFVYPIEEGIPNLLPRSFHEAGVADPKGSGA